MVNLRLRRVGLPVAVSALVAAVAVTGTIIANGTAGAETAAPGPDPGYAAIQQAAFVAHKNAKKKPAKKLARAAAGAPTDELKFGDLTGDGKADLAAVDSTGVLWVYPGKAYRWDGQGTRSTSLFETRFKVGGGWAKFTSLVRHGDFDSDGKQDVLVRDSAGVLFLYAGTGTTPSVLGKGKQVGTSWGSFTSIVGGGDLNLDGKDDLLGQKSNGDLLLYANTGNPAVPFTKGKIIGTGFRGSLLTTVGDWTYDLRPEFMFRNTQNVVRKYESKSGEMPIGGSEIVVDATGGSVLTNMIGMGDLTSDETYEPLPDVLLQGQDGSLTMYSWDWDPASPEATKVGRGWGAYRLF